MSDEKKSESIAEKQVSRRSVLKWTGALAAGAIVGGAAMYGATYKAPPPPPPSFKPPLSTENQARVDQIVKQMVDMHTGETLVANTCNMNCGGNSQCNWVMRIKDGVIKAIEPDFRYNKNIGMEDQYMTQQDLERAKFQRRSCPMVNLFHKWYYMPTRLQYPLKLAPGSQKGEGKYVRTTWDDAITTIAGKLKETKDKYGPFSISHAAGDGPSSLSKLGSWLGCGLVGWGADSYDSERLSCMLVGGIPGAGKFQDMSSVTDVWKYCKLYVAFGYDPSVDRGGPSQATLWYLRMMKEKGVPVIVFDPRYSQFAALSDQWIPIKSGTDMAMLCAIANVMFKEDSYNKDFISKFVEPAGFQEWKDYILGVTEGPDGKVDRTPAWAEKITSVPAETTVALTHALLKAAPNVAFLQYRASNRKAMGHNAGRAKMIICMMLGSFAAPGCGGLVGTEPFGAWERNLSRATAPSQGYTNPASKTGPFYVANWSRKHLNLIATNLLPDLHSGKMTVADYRRTVGTRTELPILPLIDIHLYWAGAGNTFSMVADSVNDHIQAYKAVDFSFGFGASTRFTGNYYQDYVLPSVEPVFEDSALTSSNYAGFNELNMRRGPFKPPGECKQDAWFYMELYKKLGFNPNDYSNTYRDATYYEDTEARNKASYELRAQDALKNRNQQWPTWDQFRNDPNYAYINIDEYYKDTDHGGNWADKIMWEEPSAAIGGTVIGGTTEHYSAPKVGKPIATKSGKLEPSSWFLKDKTKLAEAEHFDLLGNAIDFLQSDWGYYTDYPKYGTWPIPVYQPLPYGLEDNPLVKTQPLYFASSHSRYRHHSQMGDHPYGAGETYRHACWISVADAKARGIVDGDLVRVYNPKGETMVPAYVTNKISPGHTVVRIGMWYKPNAAGVDRGGNAQMVLGQDITTICKTPCFVTASVQVEKV